jgi:hypothetical protein
MNTMVRNASSSGYKSLQDKLTNFNIDSFNDDKQTEQYVELFSLQQLCQSLEIDGTSTRYKDLERSVSAFEEKPFEPEYNDLARLHYIALTRKCVNIMEFGSGFSTVIFADAMRTLKNYFLDYAKENIRVDMPFHVFSVEEEQRFLEVTLNRLGGKLSHFASVSKSSIEVILHDNRIATIYSKLPNISPDLIYIDGPSQFGSTKEMNGFSFDSKSRMPMSADILFFEFFLEPGTLILVDGRTANARFLKSYLRRNWAYRHDSFGDIHYFELQEEPLGPFNKNKLEFCLEGKWLLA